MLSINNNVYLKILRQSPYQSVRFGKFLLELGPKQSDGERYWSKRFFYGSLMLDRSQPYYKDSRINVHSRIVYCSTHFSM